MKKDHNVYVSRLSFYYSILTILKNFLKYYLQCIIVGTVYMWLIFLHDKVIEIFRFLFVIWKFQISYNNLKLSVFQKILKLHFWLGGILHFCLMVYSRCNLPTILSWPLATFKGLRTVRFREQTTRSLPTMSPHNSWLVWATKYTDG